MNYLVLTVKSWNIENFRKLQKQDKRHRWFLISRPEDLTYVRVKKINPRYIFVPHWSWIIPVAIWKNFETVVFHEAVLPYGRGGSPIQNLIWRGHKTTMISALRAVAELDAGPIYMQEKLSLNGTVDEILRCGSKIIFERMIPRIIAAHPKPRAQTGRPVVFRRRTPEQGQVTDDLNLTKFYDLIRMLDGEGYPNAFLEIGKLRLEFSRAKFKKGELICEVKIHERKK